MNVECIDSNPLPEGMQWEYRQKEELLDLNLILEKKYHHLAVIIFQGMPVFIGAEGMAGRTDSQTEIA